MLIVFGFSKRVAFFSALLFAIHPVHTDAVSYISGRRDVLMGLFYVLSVGWFMKFYNGNNSLNPSYKKRETSSSLSLSKRGLGRVLELLLSLFFLFLSISSKEMGATIPLIFILYIIYKDGAKLLKKRWFYVTMMLLLLLFTFFVFFAISSGGSGLISLEGVKYHGNSPQVHYLTASTIWLYYLKLTIFPLNLILDNASYPLVHEWNYSVFFSVLSMFIFGWLVWRLVTTRSTHSQDPSSFNSRVIAFWMVFYLITLAPVLQILFFHEIVAEHYLYVPSLSFGIIVSIMIDKLLVKRRKLGIIIIMTLSLFFSLQTIRRNFQLRNIWEVLHADEKVRPLSFRGLFTIGAEYIYMKFPDTAKGYYDRAVKTGYMDGNLHSNIIGYYVIKGMHKKAYDYYISNTSKGEHLSDQGWLNIAAILTINGDCDGAFKIIEKLVPNKLTLKTIEKIKKCHDYEFNNFGDSDLGDIFHKQELMKVAGFDIERKPYLKVLVESGEFEGEELIDIVHELAVVNLQSDVPEAIKYYKMEEDLYKEQNKPVPQIVDKSIKVLEDYKHKVLVEGIYYKLAY